MPTVYTLVATKCPAIPARTTFLDYTTGAPALFPDETGQATVSKTRVNAISKKVEAASAGGVGAYAVDYGLVLTDSGTSLVASVSAGQATIDGPVILNAAGTVTLADNAYNWIYLLQNGTLTKTSSATDTPPANPSATCVFLGRVTVASGAITQIDGSGVMYFLGGYLYRRTGDADMPADTPPSTLAFSCITQSATFRWSGLQYEDPGQNALAATLTFASADITLSPAHYRKGTLVAAGTNAAPQSLILPNIAGLTYTVVNSTGQALTCKVSAGTGVAIATGKTAIIRATGTDYVRVTPDT